MPITSAPDHSKRLIRTVCSGHITLDEITHYQATAFLNPDIYGYNELFDMTDGDYSEIQFSDMINVADHATKLYMIDPNTRLAILAADTLQRQLADFYISTQSMTQGPSREIRRFDKLEEALDWLLEDYA